jgi:hypothetical protein
MFMRRCFLFLTFFIALFMSDESIAQNNKAKPCAAAECSQFDFWLGEWNLTYNDTVHATNSITKEMEGCLIHEHFHDPANNYSGESWSVYNAQKKVWQQTWVDNQAGYILLTGSLTDGKMILSTEPMLLPDGTKKQSRMVFSAITANSLQWVWEATIDEGKTWTTNWKIAYTRKQ